MATKIVSEDYRTALMCAIDVSSKKWVICCRNVEGKLREMSIDAFDVLGLSAELGCARAKLGLEETAPVYVLHEAGRDGFAVHRMLESIGARSIIADAGSLEQPRRGGRRRKTDKLDAKKLVNKLYLHLSGERAFSVVRPISADDEDVRQLVREREALVQHRTAVRNQISSLFALHGICVQGATRDRLGKNLGTVRNALGEPLPRHLHTRLGRAYEHLEFLTAQIESIESEQTAVAAETTGCSKLPRKVQDLQRLVGVGPQTSLLLTTELLWRDFQRGKEVSGATGMCGTPYDTGDSSREQGISKAGNRRVRTSLVELAWRWLRWQADSALTQWFQRKWGDGTRRSRRVGIVALARRLAVALWRYVEHGVVPEGARLSS